MSLEILRKDLKTREMIFGADRTIKLLKNGKIERVYLASNCSDSNKNDILYYSKLAGIEAEELEESNEDLATICKKPFNISVVSVKK